MALTFLFGFVLGAAGPPGVPHPFLLLRDVPVRSRVAHALSEPAAVGLPRLEVSRNRPVALLRQPCWAGADHRLCCRYTSRPVMSSPGLYDPTTIMNADILAFCQKEGWCKLAFYLLSFFYYLYG